MTRILVIEDEAPIRALLTDLLESEGYAVSEAATGADGLRQLDLQRRRRLMPELMRPEMDGRTIAEICHQRTLSGPVPILLVSVAPHWWHIAEQLRRFGVRGFVSKPFDVETFLAAVDRLTAPAPVLAAAG